MRPIGDRPHRTGACPQFLLGDSHPRTRALSREHETAPPRDRALRGRGCARAAGAENSVFARHRLRTLARSGSRGGAGTNAHRWCDTKTARPSVEARKGLRDRLESSLALVSRLAQCRRVCRVPQRISAPLREPLRRGQIRASSGCAEPFRVSTQGLFSFRVRATRGVRARRRVKPRRGDWGGTATRQAVRLETRRRLATVNRRNADDAPTVSWSAAQPPNKDARTTVVKSY